MTEIIDQVDTATSRKIESGRQVPKWLIFVLGGLTIVMYSSFERPIWFDEFVQFAMGGMDFKYAIQTIDWTTIEVNQGQTGLYHLIDYFLLQVFGASAMALRFPSIISGAVLIFAAVVFIKSKGLDRNWQMLTVIALFGHSFLMFFVGEARSYMSMAASAVAMFSYYSLNAEQRRTFTGRFLGVFGFIVGSMMHPYWMVFFGLSLIFSSWTMKKFPFVNVNLKSWMTFINPRFAISGLILYVLIGQLTWMRKQIQWSFDPWQFNGGSAEGAFRSFLYDQFSGGGINFWWPLTLLGLALVLIVGYRILGAPGLLDSIALLAVALFSSAFVTWLSLYRGFWVYERQWLGGLAIGVIALVWMFGELWRYARSNNNFVLRILVYSFVSLTVVTALFAMRNQVEALMSYQQEQKKIVDDGREPIDFKIGNYSDVDPVLAANINIKRGGPVWPYFTDWYNNEAGMRPEFREYNPSWSRFLWPDG
jgi:hypothetical protein